MTFIHPGDASNNPGATQSLLKAAAEGNLREARYWHWMRGVHQDDVGSTAFILAAKGGHKATLEWLLPFSHCHYLNPLDVYGEAFNEAVEHGHTAIAQWLLPLMNRDTHKTDIDTRNHETRLWNAVISAVRQGHDDTVSLLAEHPDVNLSKIWRDALEIKLWQVIETLSVYRPTEDLESVLKAHPEAPLAKLQARLIAEKLAREPLTPAAANPVKRRM